jgi:hypothetical protein
LYLLYADESGDLTDPATNVFVVGAIAVHEDAVRPLAGEINGTMNQFLGRKVADKVELHGSPMRAGAGEWRNIPEKKRHGLYHALLRKLETWEHKDTRSRIEPFVVIMDRDHSQSPTETTYGELLYAFDRVLRDHRKTGDPHNGVLIADESRYERTLQAWVELARASKSRPSQDYRRLYALAETPFFVNSRLTRLMQLADLVAHAFYRAYNASEWYWAESALPALEEPNRLAHFTGEKACDCPACAA